MGESLDRESTEWVPTDKKPPPGQSSEVMKIKKDKRTYASTYRTQWVLLVFLSPVILPIIFIKDTKISIILSYLIIFTILIFVNYYKNKDILSAISK